MKQKVFIKLGRPFHRFIFRIPPSTPQDEGNSILIKAEILSIKEDKPWWKFPKQKQGLVPGILTVRITDLKNIPGNLYIQTNKEIN